MAVKKIVNPYNRDIRAVNLGAGADFSNFLLSTNASEACFVDQTLIDWKYLLHLKETAWDALDVGEYKEWKSIDGYGESSAHDMQDIEMRILCELRSLDVKKDTIKITEIGKGAGRITFRWQYLGAGEKTYTVIYCSGFSLRWRMPLFYPKLFKEFIRKKIDVCYLRAGVGLPGYYKKFLPFIASYLKNYWFLVTNDIALESSHIVSIKFRSEYIEKNPDLLLGKMRKARFTRKGEISSPEMEYYAGLIREKRSRDYPMTHDGWLEYGWNVQLRMKLPLQKKSRILLTSL